jgi:hypothetical protein
MCGAGSTVYPRSASAALRPGKGCEAVSERKGSLLRRRKLLQGGAIGPHDQGRSRCSQVCSLERDARGVRSRNVAELVTAPKQRKRKVAPWSSDEARRFLESARSDRDVMRPTC